MSDLTAVQKRNEVFDYVRTMLGDGMVEVELDPKHLEIALNRALTKFRQRSSNAVEESYMFLELIQDQKEQSEVEVV
jgi:translation initiation factor IF-1